MSISKPMLFDKSVDEDKIPSFAKTEHYPTIFDWLCQRPDERQLNLTQLAARCEISRQAIYYILAHDYTKMKLKEYFRALASQDQLEMYYALRDQARKNPHSQKLWHDYYSIIEQEKEKTGGQIIVQIGIFSDKGEDHIFEE